MSRSTYAVSPLSLTIMTVDVRVPFHRALVFCGSVLRNKSSPNLMGGIVVDKVRSMSLVIGRLCLCSITSFSALTHYKLSNYVGTTHERTPNIRSTSPSSPSPFSSHSLKLFSIFFSPCCTFGHFSSRGEFESPTHLIWPCSPPQSELVRSMQEGDGRFVK